MKYQCFYDGTFASNCYLVMTDDEEYGIIIDPSVSYDFVFRQRHSLPKIEKILLTHAHFDHVLCLEEWKHYMSTAQITIAIHPITTTTMKI